MRMIIAVDNKCLEEKLINNYYKEYEIYTIRSLDLIEKVCENDSVVVVKENLKGKNDLIYLVKNIRKKGLKTKFIVIVKKLSNEIKQALFLNDIFNIIEGTKFPFEELTDMINNPQMVIYKNHAKKKNNNIIAVTGSFGVGKTTIAYLISLILAKKKKTLLIDLDIIHPTLDCIVSNAKNYSLGDLVKDVENNSFKNVMNYITPDTKNKNLHYILNGTSISVPTDKTILNIIELFKNSYDYIVIDTSSMIMNKVYSMKLNIVHVIEPTLRSFKAYKLDTKLISKESLCNAMILCNKYTNYFELRRFKKMVSLKIASSVKYSSICRLFNTISLWMFKVNITYVLKRLGINKFNNIRRILKSIINEEE